ncbi:peptidase domain-containing protein [Nostoc commune NIES-4072]|uniref:Peptidase domain-containing protein n=1 Tax=Nostoc commune NIES-4072 TaxID=2005467 RepID=A0A2R5FP13_NOSCO|nr:PEP-CTERM sorting domain-containing protein [Nostoc commune]BBD68498.1 peptidase domain-containing protein [Nostoc commune HK-02]GBG20510.1 peptidase domain-containing protein [Nostoc commune NIES-4072]
MTVVNGNFEVGTFSNWRTIGDTRIETAALGTGTSEGTFQALLTTGASASGGSVEQSDLEEFLNFSSGLLDNLGNGDATEGSAIKQTFTANAGDVLTFDWNFLTNEATPSSFNDFAFFGVSPFALELADTNSSGFFGTSAVNFSQETGFQTISVGIAQTGTYTLNFGVVDVGDASVDSALIVDNIQVLSLGSIASNNDVLFGATGFVGESPLSSSAITNVEQLTSSNAIGTGRDTTF